MKCLIFSAQKVKGPRKPRAAEFPGGCKSCRQHKGGERIESIRAVFLLMLSSFPFRATKGINGESINSDGKDWCKERF